MVPGFRVGCMGAGGTGKSTTANHLEDVFELERLRSASRMVYEANDLTEEKVLDMPMNAKWQLQARIFDSKVEMDDNTSSFIADRTLLDHWAYCLMYCGAHMPNKEFQKYETMVRKHMMSTYSVMFYFGWGHWDIPEKDKDGVRSNSNAWQSAIDALIVGYCLRWNLPVINLPQTLGEDHRNESAENVIRERLGLDKTSG